MFRKAGRGLRPFSPVDSENRPLYKTHPLSSTRGKALAVPGTAKNPAAAMAFVRFLLLPEGKALLEANGQPPVAPPILSGSVPAELK